MKIISNLVKSSFIIASALAIITSCSKNNPTAPTDETLNRGHELPDKMELISTDLGTNEQQKRTANVSSEGLQYDVATPIIWKAGHSYRFEIVYSNNGKRINDEFVSEKMAPIHQHFFLLYQGKYPTAAERNTVIANMDKLMSYQYQDTDPEIGYYGDPGVKILTRSWDKNHPEEPDPIGLKGIFHINDTDITGDFNLRIRLAHFLVANKLDPTTGSIRKYNTLRPTAAYATDTNITLPIRITK